MSSVQKILKQEVGHTATGEDLKELGLTRGDLMMEAISVFKEIGLTPRQLAENLEEKTREAERWWNLQVDFGTRVNQQAEQIDTLTSQRNELLEALQPFADLLKRVANDAHSETKIFASAMGTIDANEPLFTIGQLQDALAAIAKAQQEGGAA